MNNMNLEAISGYREILNDRNALADVSAATSTTVSAQRQERKVVNESDIDPLDFLQLILSTKKMVS